MIFVFFSPWFSFLFFVNFLFIDNLKIGINDFIYFFPKLLTIFQICLKKRIYIPRFCYHNRLKIAGNCRMCLVEDKKSIKPLASCSILANSGIFFFTKTSVVKKSREGVIEYLLINHPLDCPICDQGGECDLQDQAMIFGNDFSRFHENDKRVVENKNFSNLIKSSFNRCIQCGRCVRFLEDLASSRELNLLGRGLKTEISSFFSSKLSGEVLANIIDLCPVGALTAKSNSFKTRSWEVAYSNSIDIFDSWASNIRLEFNGLNIIRVLPKTNKWINGEWISDKIRFIFDSFYYQRLDWPRFVKKKAFINFYDIFFSIKIFYSNLIIFFKNFKKRFFYQKYYLGKFSDYVDSIIMKITYNQFGASIVSSYQRQFISSDLRLNFLWKALRNKICFVGSNPRFELPVVNIKFKLLAYVYRLIGFLSNLNHSFIHFGTSLNRAISLIDKSLFSIITNSSNKAVFPLINYFDVEGLNIIPPSISEMGFFDNNSFNNLTLVNLKNSLFTNLGLLYFWTFDDYEINIEYSDFFFKIYHGSHWDYSALRSNAVLPHRIYIEHPTLYLNSLGISQFSDNLFFTVNKFKVPDDFSIISAFLGSMFNQYIPSLILSFYIPTSYGKSLFYYGTSLLLDYNPLLRAELYFHEILLKSNINDYFLGDFFSRSSTIMAITSKLNNTLNDFKYTLYNSMDNNLISLNG